MNGALLLIMSWHITVKDNQCFNKTTCTYSVTDECEQHQHNDRLLNQLHLQGIEREV